MLLHIPEVLSGAALARCRALLEEAPWGDGRVTAGSQSVQVKNNQQLPEDHPLTGELQQIVLEGLAASLLFFTAALPKKIFPPLFNRYAGASNACGTANSAARACVPTCRPRCSWPTRRATTAASW
jgi:PKHD-type hydroxylase